MALEDIIRRIGDDADREASELIAGARFRAETLLAESRQQAEGVREEITQEALDRATRERETLLANARLSARDRALRARMELIERVLRSAEEEIVALPDERYAAWIAGEVAAVARGGERLRIGSADYDRLASSIESAIARAAESNGHGAVDVTVEGRTDDFERGVMLVGPRMSVTISPQAFIASQREELTARAATLLFGESEKVT